MHRDGESPQAPRQPPIEGAEADQSTEARPGNGPAAAPIRPPTFMPAIANPSAQPAPVAVALPARVFRRPAPGEVIRATITGHTYSIGQRVGAGAFGEVYECMDDWNNRLVVKVVMPAQRSYEQTREHALGEYNRLMHLRHPFITYVYDAFEYRDTFYVVMEQCVRSLAEMMAAPGYRGDVWIMAIARNVLQALQFVHNAGMVHQDIHAGNVLWHSSHDEMLPDRMATCFKLSDLGIAKMAHEIDPANTLLNESIVAPEAIDSAEFGRMDHRMDVYHCALLFLSVLSGRALTYTRDQILAGVPRQDAETLQAPYGFALSKALRRHVEHRTASARGLWEDLMTPRTI